MKTHPAGLLLALLLILPHTLWGFDREAWTSFTNMNYVTGVAEGDTRIYVGTTGGIRRYDRFTRRWLSPLTTSEGLPDNRIQRLAYDPPTGDLWFETPGGWARWLTRMESISYAGTRPRNIGPSPNRQPIPRVVPPYGYYLEDNLVRGPRRTYTITDAFVDTWNVLWIGTWGLGVGRADMHDQQLAFLRYGPMVENVTALARDNEHIWFGGEDTFNAPARGITRYNTRTGIWDYFEADQFLGIDDAHISTILPDTADVWFGTREGLLRYTKGEDHWFSYRLPWRHDGQITSLSRDGRRLWIGTTEGLVVFDLQGDTLRTVEGSERFVIRALDAGPDFVWAGTDLGLYRCPRGDVTWTSVRSPDGLPQNPIRAVFARTGDLWAAVDAPSGLIRLRGETWQRFALAEIRGSRKVAVAADAHRAWVATEQGAYRLDIAGDLWKRYTRSDGLIHDRVQEVLLDGDYVWFGTMEGVSRFHWARDFFESRR